MRSLFTIAAVSFCICFSCSAAFSQSFRTEVTQTPSGQAVAFFLQNGDTNGARTFSLDITPDVPSIEFLNFDSDGFDSDGGVFSILAPGDEATFRNAALQGMGLGQPFFSIVDLGSSANGLSFAAGILGGTLPAEETFIANVLLAENTSGTLSAVFANSLGDQVGSTSFRFGAIVPEPTGAILSCVGIAWMAAGQRRRP